MLGFATVAEAAPHSNAAAKCEITFISIFLFAYSATWGSLGPIVIGEVPSNRLRTKTISVAIGLSWLMALLVITSIPYLINPQYLNLGTKVGFIFGGLTVIVFVLTIIFVPETKDRTLEEIDEMFLNVSQLRPIMRLSLTDLIQRVPTLKFKTYVCTRQVAGFDLTAPASEKNAVTFIEVRGKEVEV